MKRNLLQNVIKFIIRYIWLFCLVLIFLELLSTTYSASLLLQQSSTSVLRAQAGEVSGRVDGVHRLLNGLATDKIIGDTRLPIFDRAKRTISYQNSYRLYMIAVLDKDFNMMPANATDPHQPPGNRADRDYLQRMQATGQYQITDVIISRSDGRTKNYTIAIPLFRDGVLDGAIFGSIYLDDIEAMFAREDKGEFFLVGRNRTVMIDKGGHNEGKSISNIYSNLVFGKSHLSDIHSGSAGGFWMVDGAGLAYISYRGVDLTEWTLVYERRLNSVLPAVLPMLMLKIFLYIALCWLVANFGRRYLEQQLSTASHLIERVTLMQKELFRSEQEDCEAILELTKQGLTDHLTGLATRSVLIKRFAQLVESGNNKGLLCFLDLDNLKHLNDTFGHETGDLAIMHFAKILKHYEEKYHGIAARYGGDEFILTLSDIADKDVRRIMTELCNDLTGTLQLGETTQSVAIQCSIGVAFYPQHGITLEELISKADLALYISKHNGKGQYTIFDANN